MHTYELCANCNKTIDTQKSTKWTRCKDCDAILCEDCKDIRYPMCHTQQVNRPGANTTKDSSDTQDRHTH